MSDVVKKWASDEDREKAKEDLMLFGQCATKDIGGVLHHVPLVDVVEYPEDTPNP